MAGNLQQKRLTTSGLIAATPLVGQIYLDSDTLLTSIGDGATAGGIIISGLRRNTQSGTTYTILASDAGKLVTVNNASPVAVTLPQAGSSGGAFFPAQYHFTILNLGTGLATITPTTSTINGLSILNLLTNDAAIIFSDGTNYFAAICRNVMVQPGTANYDQSVWNSSSSLWEPQRARYIIGSSTSGLMTASQNLLFHRVSKAITIPANFGSFLGHASQAGGSVNATGSPVINVDKAANATPTSFSNVGTITIGAGSVTPTFATSGAAIVNFAQGDVLRIQAPASPDATFADFYATIVAFET